MLWVTDLTGFGAVENRGARTPGQPRSPTNAPPSHSQPHAESRGCALWPKTRPAPHASESRERPGVIHQAVVATPIASSRRFGPAAQRSVGPVQTEPTRASPSMLFSGAGGL